MWFKKNKKNEKKIKKSVDMEIPNIYTATTASKGADVVWLSEQERVDARTVVSPIFKDYDWSGFVHWKE